MRSRYTAYTLGGHGEYLISTWLPTSSQQLSAEELSQKTFNWQRLEVITSSQQGDNGIVEFKAWFSTSENSEDMEAMHEVSEFIRIQSRWFYVGAR